MTNIENAGKNAQEARDDSAANASEANASGMWSGLSPEHLERIERVAALVARIAYGVAVFTGVLGMSLIVIAALGWITNAVWLEVKASLESGDLWRAASIAVLVLPATFFVTGRLARKGAAWAADKRSEEDETAEAEVGEDNAA